MALKLADLGLLRGGEIATKGISTEEKHKRNFKYFLGALGELLSSLKTSEKEREIGNNKFSGDKLLLLAFNYYMGLIFGVLSSENKLPQKKSDENIFIYIFDRLVKYNGKNILKVELGLNTYAVLKNIGVYRSNFTNEIFSVKGLNCRLETSHKKKIETTKYFDFYISSQRIFGQSYLITCDIQMDNIGIYYQVKVNMEPWLASNYSSLPQIVCCNKKYKEYDFGTFSEEIIYPNPSMKLNNPWVVCFLTQLKNFNFNSESKLFLMIESSFRKYISYSDDVVDGKGKRVAFFLNNIFGKK